MSLVVKYSEHLFRIEAILFNNDVKYVLVYEAFKADRNTVLVPFPTSFYSRSLHKYLFSISCSTLHITPTFAVSYIKFILKCRGSPKVK